MYRLIPLRMLRRTAGVVSGKDEEADTAISVCIKEIFGATEGRSKLSCKPCCHIRTVKSNENRAIAHFQPVLACLIKSTCED